MAPSPDRETWGCAATRSVRGGRPSLCETGRFRRISTWKGPFRGRSRHGRRTCDRHASLGGHGRMQHMPESRKLAPTTRGRHIRGSHTSPRGQVSMCGAGFHTRNPSVIKIGSANPASHDVARLPRHPTHSSDTPTEASPAGGIPQNASPRRRGGPAFTRLAAVIHPLAILPVCGQTHSHHPPHPRQVALHHTPAVAPHDCQNGALFTETGLLASSHSSSLRRETLISGVQSISQTDTMTLRL